LWVENKRPEQFWRSGKGITSVEFHNFYLCAAGGEL
jgi:hypothetical protein